MHEKYGCVDQNPPTLKLRHDPNGDKTLRLKQGDEYREYMVDIVDDNAEDYLRSLKVSYSRPLPPGCLTEVGEFHVNYTIAMPWAKVPFVRETRRVIIEDIDECGLDVSTYERTCPALVPQCDTAAGAKCVNTHGSYQCKCPSQSSGDGFVKGAKFDGFPAPEAYKGGTSCVDTSKPIITLRGPNPKVLKICECGGLSGVMNPSKGGSGDNELQLGQRKMYEDDIKVRNCYVFVSRLLLVFQFFSHRSFRKWFVPRLERNCAPHQVTRIQSRRIALRRWIEPTKGMWICQIE